MDGRAFRNFMGAFLGFARKAWFNYVCAIGMGIAPIVALARSTTDRSARQRNVVAKKWAACEVLILDPLGPEETIPAATSRFLVGLLDQRGPRSLALASNLTEAEISARYGEEVASRLLSGAVIPSLYGKDFRRHGVAA
ncbi:MAG: hypothetical protein HC938_16795 [Nitrospira sp.]|nr:hypothetical protein [Nitrospira sp.]